MSDVFVLGALHHDVVVDAPRMPIIDETLMGSAVDYRFGGKGGNQALAARRFGASVAFAGRIGRDAAGDAMLECLDSAGVNRVDVLRADAPTGMSVAITLPNGDYAAVVVSGANLENDGGVEFATAPKVALLQNEIPPAANERFAARLPRETKLILNAAPARPLPDALAGRVDLLVVNRVEAQTMADVGDLEKAAARLSRLISGAVLVTQGGGDAVLFDDGQIHLIPVPQVDVVSSHGAGDLLVGALAAEIARGQSLHAAAGFAVTAASTYVALPVPERASFRG